MKIERYCDMRTKTLYHVISIPKARYTPSVYVPNGTAIGTQSTLEMVQDKGFPIAINAGLFHPVHQYPEGIIIADGVVIQNKPTTFYPGCMALTISRGGNLWHADGYADANELVKQGIVHAVNGFMPIVIDHEAVPQSEWVNVRHFGDMHQRQIIGQYNNGDYAIITCEGRGYADSVGWTIAETQAICIRHGLKYAYNLDGGTSTETVINGKQINSFYKREPMGRIVPTYIVFNER